MEIIETKWFKNGDYPGDGKEIFQSGEFKGQLLEGKVVRRYNNPYVDGQSLCEVCNHKMQTHGYIDSSEKGCTVCPGDVIVSNRDKILYVLKTFTEGKLKISLEKKYRRDNNRIRLIFKIGKYYKHPIAGCIHIISAAKTTSYGWTLLAETHNSNNNSNNNFIAVGSYPDSTTDWVEINGKEWIAGYSK